MSSSMNHDTPDRPWLRRYSKLLCAAVLFLIFAGSLVSSHDAGLAVPDWPTSFGQNMFLFPPSEWKGGIFYEHVHRLIASVIGFMTVVLAVWVWRVEHRRWVKVLTGCSLLAVVVQGILGGVTVHFKLPTIVSTSHAMLAQTFFLMTIVIAFSQSRELVAASGGARSRERTLALITVALLFIQLFLGAWMRHSRAGIAVPDFPSMGGSYSLTFGEERLAIINEMRLAIGLAPVTFAQVAVHLLHRAGAIVVALWIVGCGLLIMRRYASDLLVRRTALATISLVLLQFALGVLTVLSVRAPMVASLHVVNGALLLGISMLLFLRIYSRQPGRI